MELKVFWKKLNVIFMITRGERLRSGVRVTIIGEPNVGKSSLLNLIGKFKLVRYHDIAEILLKLACNTNQSINQSINQIG